jgi:hypothetical protein
MIWIQTLRKLDNGENKRNKNLRIKYFKIKKIWNFKESSIRKTNKMIKIETTKWKIKRMLKMKIK